MPSAQAADVDLYGEGTWLTDAAHEADPAWPPRVAGQDRATPLSPHPAPTQRSDLRNDDSVPASTHPACLFSHGPRASSEPGLAPPPRTRHLTGSVASTERSLSARLHSRRAVALVIQAS